MSMTREVPARGAGDHPALHLFECAYDSPAAWPLVRALHAEQMSVYAYADDPSDTDPRTFAPGAGCFLVGYAEQRPVACGGVRLHGVGDAEVKRMYVAPAWRGLGYGRQLLAALEAAARSAGRERIVLETGVRNLRALRLYASCGYEPIPAYVSSRNPEVNRAFAKILAS